MYGYSVPFSVANGVSQIPSNTLSCPEDDVTLWSWSTFSFIEPLFRVANVRTIEESDVWNLSPFFQHKIIFGKLLEYKARCVNCC